MIEIRFIIFLLCSGTIFIKNSLAESCISQNSCLCQIDDDSKIDLSSLLDDDTQYLEDTKEDITYLFSGCKDTIFNVTVKDANGTHINDNVTASLLLLNNTNMNYTILGHAKGIHFTKNAESKYYEIVYNDINNQVTATIELICDDLKVPFLKTIDSKLKVFALASPKVCLVVEHKGMSGGSKFLLVLFITILVYFVGGGLVMYLIRGARGLEMIPNIDFWRNLPSLVKDGIIFLLAGCRPTLITSAETYDRI